MASRKKFRKQRVSLRARRRVAIKSRMRHVVMRVFIVALGMGLLFAMASEGDALLARWMVDYSPTISIQSPDSLPSLILEPEFPKNRCWMWLPWVRSRMERQLLKHHAMVQRIKFTPEWASRSMTILPVLRKPLVRVGPAMAMDAEGSVFPWAPGGLSELPGFQSAATTSQSSLAPWVQQLSRQQILWSKIAMIKQDRFGQITLELQSGTKVLWGAPVTEAIDAKTRAMLNVLADAQTNLKGAASADLRFFSDGRIIVAPRR